MHSRPRPAPSVRPAGVAPQGLPESAEATLYESSVVHYFTEKALEHGGRERAVEDLLDVLEIRFGLAARIGAIDDGSAPRSLQQPARRRRVGTPRNGASLS